MYPINVSETISALHCQLGFFHLSRIATRIDQTMDGTSSSFGYKGWEEATNKLGFFTAAQKLEMVDFVLSS